MVEIFPVAMLVGTVLGFLTGLGVGGGSLLILWLTMAVQMEQDAARCINLLFFLPSALISCLFRRKQGAVDLKTALPAIFAGCTASVIFSLVSGSIDTNVLKKLFGALLILTGLRELFYKPQSPGNAGKTEGAQ